LDQQNILSNESIGSIEEFLPFCSNLWPNTPIKNSDRSILWWR